VGLHRCSIQKERQTFQYGSLRTDSNPRRAELGFESGLRFVLGATLCGSTHSPMTAEEIRELVTEMKVSKTVMRNPAPLRDILLAEIAAQLAELNFFLRTYPIDVRKVDDE
jgi:hypothetical protein